MLRRASPATLSLSGSTRKGRVKLAVGRRVTGFVLPRQALTGAQLSRAETVVILSPFHLSHLAFPGVSTHFTKTRHLSG